jgi:exopolysaccharide biosynthesis WecB/TagA/CpsF family protein
MGRDLIGKANVLDKPDEGDGRPFHRVQVLKLGFDQLTREMAVAYLWAWPSRAPYGYVTTPNVDHLVRLRTERHTQEVEEAYVASDLTLCDSKVMALLSRWYGVDLSVATGSDVTEDLLDRLRGSNEPLLIIGGGPETAPVLAERYGLTNLHQHIPPMGLMRNEAALNEAARFIVANPARFVFIAVGSPQQEVIALRARKLGATCGVALCVGASLDYLTGRSKRAPWVLRVLALEWLYRLMREPRRLWRRYLVRSPRIFSLMHEDARARRRLRKHGSDGGNV